MSARKLSRCGDYSVASADRPYSVIILAGTKRGQWGNYPTIEQAAEVAAKLRRHGFYAVVEGAE